MLDEAYINKEKLLVSIRSDEKLLAEAIIKDDQIDFRKTLCFLSDGKRCPNEWDVWSDEHLKGIYEFICELLDRFEIKDSENELSVIERP